MSRRRSDADGPLDLVPILNLVSILIPFLLVSAQFVNMAVIDTTLPGIIASDHDTDLPEQPLLLRVAIVDDGFVIGGHEGTLGDEDLHIACTTSDCVGDDSWDYDELTRTLALVKDEFPDEEALVLVPGSRVPYASVVGAMDACRASPENGGRMLFPMQTVAGGS